MLFLLLKNLDIYLCISGVMEIQLKYFIFPCTWAIKLLKYLKNQSFFGEFEVTFHMYLDIGRDYDDYYDDEYYYE